jgi:predicted PurR-regulated permease PerM
VSQPVAPDGQAEQTAQPGAAGAPTAEQTAQPGAAGAPTAEHDTTPLDDAASTETRSDSAPVDGPRSDDPAHNLDQRVAARATTRTPPPPVDLNKHDGSTPPTRTDLIGRGLVWLSQWSLRLILIGVAAWLFWRVLGELWVIVLPLFLALLLTSVLQPGVSLLRDRGMPSAAAAGLVVVTTVLALVGIVAAIAPSVTDQVTEVADRVTGGLQEIQDWVAGPPLNLSDGQFSNAINQAQERLSGSASTIAASGFTVLSAVSSALVTTVLILVLTFFMLKDGDKFTPWLDAVVGRSAGRHLTLVLRRSYGALGSFIRTQLLVSFIDAVFIGAGLLVLGVPLALPLTVLTFFGGLVPIVGALFAGAVAVLVALVTNGLTTALIVLGLIVLVQQLEGNVLSPMLQGRSLSLHPGVVILAVTAGSTLFGIVGAFLAVPTVAVVVQALRYLDELADATAAAAQATADGGKRSRTAMAARPAPRAAIVERVAPLKKSLLSRLPGTRR